MQSNTTLAVAATPEKLVKQRVVTALKRHGAYFFYPVTGGYGRSGVPDIVVCWQGRFIAIECKANGGKPTALQTKNLQEIAQTGGVAVLVDETGVAPLVSLLDIWAVIGVPSGAQSFNLLRGGDAKPI